MPVRCPTLAELSLSPHDRTGWPWTEESIRLPDTMRDGSPWPRLSIVTPSYNQCQFIEETIRSVLLQGYPDLEYIIIDGGSSDETINIISRYEPWIIDWVSERDRGQAHAINKGLSQVTGDIVAWINSDDLYLPRTFNIAAEYLKLHPNTGLIFGSVKFLNEFGREIGIWNPPEFSLEAQILQNGVPQPSVFIRQEVLDRVGLLNEDLNYAFDREYWYRVALNNIKIDRLSYPMASFRKHAISKTISHPDRFFNEHLIIYDKIKRIPNLEKELHSQVQVAYAQTLVKIGKARKSEGISQSFVHKWIRAILHRPKILLQKSVLLYIVFDFFPSAAKSFISSLLSR